jgi:hypothetical protein
LISSERLSALKDSKQPERKTKKAAINARKKQRKLNSYKTEKPAVSGLP